MGRLERDLLGDALVHQGSVEATAGFADPATVSHREVHAHFRRISAKYFSRIVRMSRS